MFQDYHLVQALNALDMVSLPLRLDGTPVAAGGPEAIHLLRASFGLSRSVFKEPTLQPTQLGRSGRPRSAGQSPPCPDAVGRLARAVAPSGVGFEIAPTSASAAVCSPAGGKEIMKRSNLRAARVLSLAFLLLPLAACDDTTTATGSADVAAGGTAAPGAAGQATPAGAPGGSSTTAVASSAATPAGPAAGGNGSAEIPDTISIGDLPTPTITEAPTDVDTAPAVFDKANNGNIEQRGAADRWTFTATAGQLLTIEIVSIDHECVQDLYLVMQDPSGKKGEVDWVGNYGCQSYGPLVMEQDGQYTLEFIGGDGSILTDTTGGYNFVPHWLAPFPEQPATPGSEITGDITETLGRQRWTFEAEAGQELTVKVGDIDHECSQDLYLVLEDPVGKRSENPEWIGNYGCNREYGPYRIERSGTQVIELKAGDGGVIANTTGRYSLSFTLS